jgi:tetratricopeptide (TPR) repeat protein
LREQEVDVGFVYVLQTDLPELKTHRISVERIVLALPQAHPLIKRKQVRLRDLKGEPFVWFPRVMNPLTYDRVLSTCHAAGVTLNIVQEGSNPTTMLSLVAGGIGLSFTQKSAERRKPDNVVLREVEDLRVTYDWRWDEAENQFKRAIELDPNSADTHQAYADLLSYTGRHAEALAEIKRARELDPLNLRTNVVEGSTLINAGRADEALAKLQQTLELDPNYWFAHTFASSAYIEKGMFAEAVAEARKAREFSEVATRPTAFLGYALAKSGRRAEARAELEGLLKSSKERYVSPYNIAMVYNGLGERDETLEWLERGYREREPRMVFLKAEPKWNNLRDDPRFQDLIRRVGLPQ